MAGRVLPGLGDIQQIVLVGVADIEGAVQNRRLVGRERIVHHHAGNRRIARVGHRQRVADRLAGHVGRAARNRGVLLDVQDLALRHRHRGVVGVRGRPGAGHRRRVDDGRPGVQLGLRHRVAGRVLPGLGDVEQIVLVGVADIEGAVQNRRLVGRERIVHHHAGNRRIARVGHRQRVADRLAGHVRPCRPEPWRPSRCAGSCSAPPAPSRRRVSEVAPVPVTVAVLTMAVPASSSACVTVMAGRVLPGLGDVEQIVLVGVADIEGADQHRRLVGRERIVHHHAGNRRIALVGHRQRVADRLAGHVGRAARNRSVLLDVQDLALRHRNRRVVGVRGRPGAGHRRRVDDGRPGVQLGLRHRVAGRVLPGLADIQQIVLVGVADIEGAVQHRRLVGRERIVHHHAGNRRIALVGHRQRVADRLAGHVGRAARNRGVLLDVQDLALRHRQPRRRRCPGSPRCRSPSPC